MPFEPKVLGRTGLRAGRVGVAASYGVPAVAVERAFECGVNYLYWGSIRRKAFGDAIRNLKPQRERFILVVLPRLVNVSCRSVSVFDFLSWD